MSNTEPTERRPSAADGAGEPKRDLIRSLQRGLSILSFVASKPQPQSAREISTRLELNLATCYHLLNTLEHEGFLARDNDRRFTLGARIGELHDAFEAQLAPDHLLVEALDELNLRTGETSYLGVWNRDDVVSVAVREGRRSVGVRASHLGYRLNAHARALGRALLAFRDPGFLDAYLGTGEFPRLTEYTVTDPEQLRRVLADVRTVGVAIEREEFLVGVCCAAAPVFRSDGFPAAALSVSAPKARFDTEGELIVQAVRDVARAASEGLAERSEPSA